jgi:hypothetical protein
MVNPNRFYTYAYLRKDRTPYYIGKGKRSRAYSKWRTGVKPPKDKSRIIFLKQNLTEEEAFKHEKYMIAVFGRKDLGTGILHNRTDGGEGATGRIHTKETKEKIGKKHKNKFVTEETRQKLRLRKGENNPRSKWWRITFADGREIILCGVYTWAKENGYDDNAISKVYRGKHKTHKDIVSVEKLEQAPFQNINPVV